MAVFICYISRVKQPIISLLSAHFYYRARGGVFRQKSGEKSENTEQRFQLLPDVVKRANDANAHATRDTAVFFPLMPLVHNYGTTVPVYRYPRNHQEKVVVEH